jgi:hypothetical protein
MKVIRLPIGHSRPWGNGLIARQCDGYFELGVWDAWRRDFAKWAYGRTRVDAVLIDFDPGPRVAPPRELDTGTPEFKAAFLIEMRKHYNKGE